MRRAVAQASRMPWLDAAAVAAGRGGGCSTSGFNGLTPSSSCWGATEGCGARDVSSFAQAKPQAEALSKALRDAGLPRDAYVNPSRRAREAEPLLPWQPAPAPPRSDDAWLAGVLPPCVDWPEGHEKELEGVLQGAPLFLKDSQAARVAEAARGGAAPRTKGELRARANLLADLSERSFPSFDVASAVVQEPRLLSFDTGRLARSMLTFQDCWPSQPVGPLMGRLGALVHRAPARLAAGLHALRGALQRQLGLPMDLERLDGRCDFLLLPPGEIESRVAAAAIIFGREDALRTLLHHPYRHLLGPAPADLNSSVLLLREALSERPGARSLSNPAKARAYVTKLVVKVPHVLELASGKTLEELVGLVAAVKAQLLRDVSYDPDVVGGGEDEGVVDKKGDGVRLLRKRKPEKLFRAILERPHLLWSCSGLRPPAASVAIDAAVARRRAAPVATAAVIQLPEAGGVEAGGSQGSQGGRGARA